MTNKQIVKYWALGFGLTFLGGFISGYNGYDDGLSAFFVFVGGLMAFYFAIWAMIRLWKS